MIELWKKYVLSLSAKDKEKMLLVVLDYIMSSDDPEIAFYMDDIVDKFGNEIPDSEYVEEHLYWTESGDNLLT